MTTISNDSSPQAIWIDTNILVYANLALSPFHTLAVERLQEYNRQGCELWVSRQSLREYLSAMTKQNVLTASIQISSLVADVQYFASRFLIGEDGTEVTDKLLNLISKYPTGGKQVHDANIVATMMNCGVNHLLTHNVKDFIRFSDVITILPLVT